MPNTNWKIEHDTPLTLELVVQEDEGEYTAQARREDGSWRCWISDPGNVAHRPSGLDYSSMESLLDSLESDLNRIRTHYRGELDRRKQAIRLEEDLLSEARCLLGHN